MDNTSLLVILMGAMAGLGFWLLMNQKHSPGDDYDKLAGKHSSDMNFVQAHFEQRASEKRLALLEALNKERAKLNDILSLAMDRQRLLYAQSELLKRLDAAACILDLTEEVQAFRLINQREDEVTNAQLLRQASQAQMLLAPYRDMVLQSKLAEQKLEQKKALDKADIEKETDLALAEIRANFVYKYFAEHQQVHMLQTQLDTTYEEIEELKKGIVPGWRKKVADRNKTVKALRENQNGIRAGLLEAFEQEVQTKTAKKTNLR